MNWRTLPDVDTTRLEYLLAGRPMDRWVWAQIGKLPLDVVKHQAVREIEKRFLRARQPIPAKLRVRVVRSQGKRLMVLAIGGRFVASFTWEGLIRKAAFGSWKKIAETTLAKRGFK